MGNEVVIRGVNDIDVIKNRIYEVRGQRVMLDRDLAELYGVETRVLNQAVKRNIERFPEDFMFQLDKGEMELLRSQFVTLYPDQIIADNKEVGLEESRLRSQIVTLDKNKDDMSSQFVMTKGRGQHSKYLPYASEHGALMLASVLKSPSAIQMSVMVTRAFIAMREALSGMMSVNYKVEQLSHKVDNLNARVDEILHEQNENNMEMAIQIGALNDALDQLREKTSTPRKRIGYKTGKRTD